MPAYLQAVGDRQTTHSYQQLSDWPSRGQGCPLTAERVEKQEMEEGGGGNDGGGALFSASLDKQVREEGKADRDAETDL